MMMIAAEFVVLYIERSFKPLADAPSTSGPSSGGRTASAPHGLWADL
jgi:hypothetical protein